MGKETDEACSKQPKSQSKKWKLMGGYNSTEHEGLIAKNTAERGLVMLNACQGVGSMMKSPEGTKQTFCRAASSN